MSPTVPSLFQSKVLSAWLGIRDRALPGHRDLRGGRRPPTGTNTSTPQSMLISDAVNRCGLCMSVHILTVYRMHICVEVGTYLCTKCECECVSVCVYPSVCLCICVYDSVCLYVCVCECLCMSVYVCMFNNNKCVSAS